MNLWYLDLFNGQLCPLATHVQELQDIVENYMEGEFWLRNSSRQIPQTAQESIELESICRIGFEPLVKFKLKVCCLMLLEFYSQEISGSKPETCTSVRVVGGDSK